MTLDDPIVRSFEDLTLPPEEFGHRQHLWVAWCYLRNLPFEEATARFMRHLRAFAGAAGAANKVHVTMTCALLAILDERMRAPDLRDRGFDELLQAHPLFLDPWEGVLLDHYTREELASPEARARFLLPGRRERSLPAAEWERLGVCLRALLPHLERDRVAIAGGVAMELALPPGARARRRDRIGDLDLVFAGGGAVSRTAARDFLVSHYHSPEAGSRRLHLQLVDPRTRMRIDLFPDGAAGSAGVTSATVGGQAVRVLPLELILDHKLALLAGASAEKRIDVKHYADAKELAAVLGRPPPAIDTRVLGKDVYSKDVAARCERCDRSRDPPFPLAPKQEIFALLGYV
jgi:hypothetical protein